MSRSKKFSFIIGILIILGGIVFFLLSNKLVSQPEVVYTNTTPKDVDWERSLPSVRLALQSEFLGSRAGETSPVKIYKTGDITGDGISEAIIDMGIGSEGSTLTFMKLMMVENNKPVTPGFKIWNGNYVSEYPFQIGSVVNRIIDVTFLPNKMALYESIRVTNANYNNCAVTVYQWNSKTKTFDFSRKLSDEITVDVCK